MFSKISASYKSAKRRRAKCTFIAFFIITTVTMIVIVGGIFNALIVIIKSKANVELENGNSSSNAEKQATVLAISLAVSTAIPPSSLLPAPSSNSTFTLLMTNKIVITALNNVNKNSLQQQQEAQYIKAAPDKQHLSLDNKNASETNSTTTTATMTITANAKGNNDIKATTATGAVRDVVAKDNDDGYDVYHDNDDVDDNGKDVVVLLADNVVSRNGFHDKINISNQRNEFNRLHRLSNTMPTTTTAAALLTTTTATIEHAMHKTLKRKNVTSSPTKMTSTTTSYLTTPSILSSHFEHKEPAATTTTTAANFSTLAKHEKLLLLHRQKRYLVFPEGSSFQLVFDLIIPIVDYTNFAIMGITCAVAWELPSKPPSEIIENFRDKLNEGTFGLSRRRNDSINENIKYVNSGDVGGAAINENSIPSIKATTSETIANAADIVSYKNDNRKVMSRPEGSIANAYQQNYHNYYYNDKSKPGTNAVKQKQQQLLHAIHPATNIAQNQISSSYYSTPSYEPSYETFTTKLLPNKYYNYKSKDNFYADKSVAWHKYSQPHIAGYRNYALDDTIANSNKKQHTKYYTKNTSNGIIGTSGYANADKQKFVDWRQKQEQQQQQQADNNDATSDDADDDYTDGYANIKDDDDFNIYSSNHYAAGDSYYSNKYYKKNTPYNKGVENTPYTEAAFKNTPKDNWWERNKQRIQTQWQQKQNDWATSYNKAKHNNYEILSPTNYAENSVKILQQQPRRTGRKRKILAAIPKHHIYPVFAKRRRRRDKHTLDSEDNHKFEQKLEQIHLREHLQTRQKLFRKIEKLYNVRGHNGSACVLRALCENGQRQPQQFHSQYQSQQHQYLKKLQKRAKQKQQHQEQEEKQQHQTEPQTFITELLRAIFILPKDIQVDFEAYANGASAALHMSNAQATKSSNSHTHMNSNEYIAEQYMAAHAYTGNCAEHFAMCKHNIWTDLAVDMM